jgi:hypothetical protein
MHTHLQPIVAELLAIFDSLDDRELLRTLASCRLTGRKGYSLTALWRAYITSYYLNLSCTNDRWLADDVQWADQVSLRQTPRWRKLQWGVAFPKSSGLSYVLQH